MKNKRMVAFVAVAFLVCPHIRTWADPQSDADHAVINEQAKTEAKARFDQARGDYEQSLSQNGAASIITKQAKSRLDDARKEFNRYARQAEKANKDLMQENAEGQSAYDTTMISHSGDAMDIRGVASEKGRG